MKDGTGCVRKYYTSRRLFPGGLGFAFLSILLSLPIISVWVSITEANPGFRIYSIAPSCTTIGSNVTLKGRGFGGKKTQVTVNGISATIIKGTGRQIDFVVPAGLASGVATVTATDNTQKRSASVALRVKGPEICGNTIDEDCDSQIDDPDVCAAVNHAPIAHAGPDQTAPVGATVQLDGSASSDIDGDLLTYQWALTSRPTGSNAVIVTPTAVKPSLTLDKAGSYTASLLVNDSALDSAPDTVLISTSNSAPTADAGPDQTGSVGDTLTFDGSGSTDADGDALTYQWSLVSRPTGSTTSLTNPTSVTPTLTLDKPGSYTVRLIVNDSALDSAPDTASVSTLNSPPVADAGPDQSGRVRETVTLDGGGSSDVDGDALSYDWSLTSKPTDSAAILTNPTTPQTTLTIDKPGTYVAQLVVNDGLANSAPDTATVTTLNSKPVAEAGSDQTALVGATITLDGSASTDVDGNALTYHWSFTAKPAGSAAALADSSAVVTTFVVDKSGTYVIQLIVNDGSVDSDPDTTTVTTLDTEPVANAGADQTAPVGATVQLDGGGSSDVDGDALTYIWALTGKPLGSNAVISDPDVVNPTFTIDKPGAYIVQLIVNDGTADSDPDTLTVNTVNSQPVANAGPDQQGAVGASLTLDGTASSDVDGDYLTYQWALLSQPVDSTAILQNPTGAQPTLTIDAPGTYVAQLIVNDGVLDSEPDTVTVTTINTKPVADAGQDQTVVVGETVQLDGSGSTDADGDSLTYQWSLATKPENSTSTITNPTAQKPSFVPDRAGLYVVQLIVTDGATDSEPDTVSITVNVAPPSNRSPTAHAGPDQTATVGATVQLNGGSSSDLDSDPLTYQWTFALTPAGSAAQLTNATSSTPSFVADVTGVFSVQLVVNDGKVDSLADTVTITVAECAPNATVVCYSGPAGTAGVGVCRAGTKTCSDQGEFGDCIGEVLPGAEIPDNGIDEDCNGEDETSGGGTLPPDPSTVAPPIDPGASTTVFGSTAFLYTGPNPIQTGVVAGTIELQRAAVIRGKVLDKNNAPLSGVTLSILNHPEFGQTLSRADGMFDLVVNGGGLLTVNYHKNGLLTAQRQVSAPWQDYAWLPDVVLIAADPQVTVVDLTATTPIQVVRGRIESDVDGTRQATLLIPSGTQAEMVFSNGSVQSLSMLSIRATEYTVGSNGPAAMPAALPPSSGYTYAMELSADEAEAAGATDIRFNQPLWYYVENFLGFPVGMIAPAGYYDKTQAVWVPSDNGRVIKILSVTDGKANVDANGDGTADTASALAALGISDAELHQLATLYSTGSSLWRVPIPHFSPWDINSPIWPPLDAKPPQVPPPHKKRPEEEPDNKCGSIIECQNQILGESIALSGAPFSLNYRSNRVPGYGAGFTIEIPVSGPTLPQSVFGIVLHVYIAGQRIVQNFPPLPNQRATFNWDGQDAYGRTMQGKLPIQVSIGYLYQGKYYSPAERPKAFAAFSATSISTESTRNTVLSCSNDGIDSCLQTLWQDWVGTVGNWDARGQGLGGWSLDVHHAYDLPGRTLYLGDGSLRSAEALNFDIIATAAGTGTACGQYIAPNFCGDGGLATKASLLGLQGVATGPDGSLYIASINGVLWRVGADGIIRRIAGTYNQFCAGTNACGDGGPALQARLSSQPRGMTIGADGSIYLADSFVNRVRRIGPDGIITTVAGTGNGGFGGDGGLATQASFNIPTDVALGPDGSLFIVDSGNNRVRQVTPNGTIFTVAGGATTSALGDGGLATAARLNGPQSIAFGPDGSFFIADSGNNRIRRVGPNGVITTVAGNQNPASNSPLSGGDGGLAVDAILFNPQAVVVGLDGSLYVTELFITPRRQAVRQVTPSGVILTIAGAPNLPLILGDGGPARQGQFDQPRDITIGPDGRLFVADYGNQRVRQISSPLPGGSALGEILIASEDGSEVYSFNGAGRHFRTLHALTGAVLYQFAYDSAGRLVGVTDGNGNTTTIEHNSNGDPTAIVGPYGQRTTLAIHPNGYLSQVTNPAGEAIQLGYTEEGLLTSFTDPRGNTSRFTYNSQGLFTREEDPAGGFQTLSRTDTGQSYTVNLSTALGRTTSYEVQSLSIGDQRRINISPDGTQTEELRATDGSQKTTFADGTILNVVEGPDPRFSMLAPLPATQTITNGGLTATLTSSRSIALTDPNNIFSLTALTDTAKINGRTFTSAYTAGTKQWTDTSAVGRQRTSILDTLGRIVRSTVAGLLPINLTYDSRGRLSTLAQGTTPDTRMTTLDYTTDGHLQTVTDPLGRTVNFAHDAAGRVTAKMLPDGRTIQYTYDSNGNLASLTPPGQPTHVFTYTPVDLNNTYVPPDVGAGTNRTLYAFNADKQLTSITRPDGKTVALGYDTAGRLSTVDMTRGQTTYAYNGTTGKLATITAPDGGALAYTYDGSLLTGVDWTGAVAGSVTRTYDNNFRLTSNKVNDANAITFQYDNDSLLIGAGSLTLNRNSQNGLLTGASLGNVTDALSYNGFGEVASYSAAYSGSTVYAVQYTRDKLRRITGKSETLNSVTTTFAYTYDTAGRLTQVTQNGVTASTYTYDSNGNRLSGPGLSTVPTYDAQDRLLTYGNAAYAYTANGELLTKTVGAQTTSYEYDELGNLLHLTLPDGTQLDYIIDGQSRRIGKKVNGALVQGLLYEGQLSPIAELDGNGNVVSRFVYGTHINVPDYMIKGGQTYRLITDQLGSPRLVINIADGTVVQQMDYDEFGNVRVDTNPGFQPFGFAGGLYDQHTRLAHFDERDYDSETGKWTTKDPILFSGGAINLYTYVYNDPINFIDIDGLQANKLCQESQKPRHPQLPEFKPDPPEATPFEKKLEKEVRHRIPPKDKLDPYNPREAHREYRKLVEQIPEKTKDEAIPNFLDKLERLYNDSSDALAGEQQQKSDQSQRQPPQRPQKLPEFKP